MTNTPVTQDLSRSYAAIRRRLLRDLDRLTRWIATEQQAGRPVTRWRLLRQQRYRDLLTQVATEMQSYAGDVEQTTIDRAAAAADRARSEAVEAMRTALGPMPAGVSMSFNQLPRGAINDITARLGVGQPLRALLDEFGGDASARAREVLISGIGAGVGPRALAREFRKTLDISAVRALAIVRQESLGAFRSSSLATYAANRGVVKKWRWVCALQPRTCGLCWAMHGKEFDLDVPFASHIACRCTPSPVTASWEELGFTDIPDTRPQQQDGATLFAALPERDRLAILGPSKLRLWDAGELSLEDLVATTQSKTWGPGRRERTLRELMAGK